MIEIDPGSPEVERGYRLLNGAKIKFPPSPLEIKLYYSRHGNNDSLDEGFAVDLSQADLFCFESMGWEKRDLDLTQRVADGDPDAVQEAEELLDASAFPDQAEFGRRIFRRLFASNVKIHFPDIPKNHPHLANYFRSTKAMAPVARLIESGDDFFVADKQLADLASNLMMASIKRDRYVLEHFFPKDLEPQPIIRIVGFFGLMHSGTAISLTRGAAKQKREDVVVMANNSHESSALFKFLNKEPISSPEFKDLIKFWLGPPNN